MADILSWSNGINDRNYASCDFIMKKLMEDKKTRLTDILIKTAAWMHNTNVNRNKHQKLSVSG